MQKPMPKKLMRIKFLKAKHGDCIVVAMIQGLIADDMNKDN
ncbi:hypothetical protein SAMN05660236_4807 [Ohtaekwangia koreensis]|uniref:Uncharacterized protein n=1 Tax=Ohtaekwangia koreensis TaxID=688867 RepID=A0A1T5M9Y3_9BACT|nr:hypothetical protein SAMN05660236_4807 [Ohtaekwangia koreensis]